MNRVVRPTNAPLQKRCSGGGGPGGPGGGGSGCQRPGGGGDR